HFRLRVDEVDRLDQRPEIAHRQVLIDGQDRLAYRGDHLLRIAGRAYLKIGKSIGASHRLIAGNIDSRRNIAAQAVIAHIAGYSYDLDHQLVIAEFLGDVPADRIAGLEKCLGEGLIDHADAWRGCRVLQSGLATQ